MSMSYNYGFKLLFKCFLKSYFYTKKTVVQLTLKRFFVISFTLFFIVIYILIHKFFLFLDELIFPSYKKIQIKKPLFIVGIPRSGTTFLHRTLSHDSDKFTTFQLWEFLLAPSIIQKMIFKHFFIKKTKKTIISTLLNNLQNKLTKKLDSMHVSRLDSPEEDFLSLTITYASFILVTPFPQIQEIWDLGYFDKKLNKKNKDKIMNFYKKILQKHLYVFGKDKRILSKNPSYTSKIQALKLHFPDCSIIACVRDPLEAVPSQISTMIEAGKLFSNNNVDHFYQKKFINLLKFYYHHIIENININEPNQYIISMNDIQKNLKKSVENIYEQLKEPINTTFKNSLIQINEQSKKYKSNHNYSLEQFELNKEKIKEDFKFTYNSLKFN